MSNRPTPLTAPLHEYLLESTLREPEILRKLRADTARLPESNMQIAPEQGQFMRLLVRMLGARKTIDIGVFTGYSALAVALTLPADGIVVACDINETWTRTAQAYWTEAGVAGKIDLRIAPALDTLAALRQSGEDGTFDFAFIDADKENVMAYYEQCLALLRAGGLVMIDNAFRDGRVADASSDDAGTAAMRQVAEVMRMDDRIDLSLVPVADGLLLGLKR
jgi:predicted O-methyltransferase YrrM